jgi:glycosidase
MKANLPLAKAAAWLAAFAVLGCQPGAEIDVPSTPSSPQAWGPTMPIRVGVAGTAFHVADALLPGEQCQTVVYHRGAAIHDTLHVANGVVWIDTPPSEGIGHLSLQVGKDPATDVPVIGKGDVAYTFTYDSRMSFTPQPTTVELAGDLNGWTRTPMVESPEGSGRFVLEAVLSPGIHPYQLALDGTQGLDPLREDRVPNGMGGWNSVVRIEAPEPPQLRAAWQDGNLLFSTDRASELLVMVDNQVVLHRAADPAIAVALALKDVAPGRHHVRAWAANGGSVSQDVLIPLEGNRPVTTTEKLSRSDWHAATMYFLMVDRFRNENPANDAPVDDPAVHPKANHHGGDLQGVVAALEEGYFDTLGINTVWVSPITTNADGAWGYWQDSARTHVTSKFSGYHGYWPVRNTAIDHRFGDEASLNALTGKAHARGMNVLLDYVANHVHEDHPLLEVHPDWTTSLYLPDGSMNTERWDDQRLTTWFDTFMPTLDLERPEVASAMADSAAWWAFHSDIDGFRHDATKHIPEAFWRLLTGKLKEAQAANGKRLFQIGETYGSPDLIASYLSSGMLDAQFDFNLYDKAVSAIAADDGQWATFQAVLEESLRTYGAHHLMGNITGNQDRPRFASLADGSLDWGEDTKFQGWTRDIDHRDDVGYARMRLLLATLATVPGIPCVYYGDEIADVGGNDPDNRRMMRFAGWNAQEAQTHAWASEWLHFRRGRMSLLYGTTACEEVQPGLLAITRTYLDESTRIYLNRTSQPVSLAETATLQPQDVLAGYLVANSVPAFGAVAIDLN